MFQFDMFSFKIFQYVDDTKKQPQFRGHIVKFTVSFLLLSCTLVYGELYVCRKIQYYSKMFTVTFIQTMYVTFKGTDRCK